MGWDDVCRALALVLIIEGLMPLLAPARWREMLMRVAGTVDERALRLYGGIMLCGGLVWLHMLRP